MEKEYMGYQIKVEQDDCNESSRDWDNLGIMVCFHNRYNLGDKHELKSSDFNGWKELEEYIQKTYDAAVILPLYLYDHSGISMKVGSFQGLLAQGHAEFDSGQVGFIYVSKEKVRKEYNWKKITQERAEKLAEYLTNEVEIYNQEISGDVWVYVITKEDDPEVHEVLGGIYGFNYAEEEAMLCVALMVKNEQEECGVQQTMELVV